MRRKLTLKVYKRVYEGLRAVVAPRKISQFTEGVVRPHVLRPDMYAAYREMGADAVRESLAAEWVETTCGDVAAQF